MTGSQNKRAAAGAAIGHVYVSSAEDGEIATWALAPDGALTAGPRVGIGATAGPIAIGDGGRFLYIAARNAPFRVHAFARARDSGALQPLGAAPAAASFPSITLDRTGRWLFGASYGGSLLSVNPVAADGRVADEPLQLIAIERNAHFVATDRGNRFVYVPALGTDSVYQFAFDAGSGRLTPLTPPSVQVDPGAGPRHFTISPDNRFLYLLCEMRGTVITFAIDGASGALRQAGSTSSLPPDTPLVPGAQRGAAAPANAAARDTSRDIWAADIHLTPDGRFLYTSERTTSALSLLAVDSATGALAYRGSTPTEPQPRSFAIDPTGRFLVACGELSGTISVYAIDAATGALGLLQQYPAGHGNNWVAIAAAA